MTIGTNVLQKNSPMLVPPKSKYPSELNAWVKENVAKISAKSVEEFIQSNPAPFYFVDYKWDGERAVMMPMDGSYALVNRHKSFYYPLPTYLQSAIKDYLNGHEVVLDNEFHTKDGELYSFLSKRKYNVEDTKGDLRVTNFDILNLDGVDVRNLPLEERRKLMVESFRPNQYVKMVGTIKAKNTAEIADAFKKITSSKFEGCVIKPSNSKYSSKESVWNKWRRSNTIDVAVLGIKKTDNFLKRGIPTSFLVGVYSKERGGWIPIVDVSSGLNTKEKMGFKAVVDDVKYNEDKDYIYTSPFTVFEMNGDSITKEGKIRHPKIIRIRGDKPPEECTVEQLKEWS